jgi:hypothetical protein
VGHPVYVTRDELRRYVQRQEDSYAIKESIVKAAAAVTVFLSHSHRDTELIKLASGLLQSQGVDVYIDHKDPDLPDKTSISTAYKLRRKIEECGKLVLVASDRAVEISRWVPWELGFADGRILQDNIAILPVQDQRGNWTGSEYVGCYNQCLSKPANTI